MIQESCVWKKARCGLLRSQLAGHLLLETELKGNHRDLLKALSVHSICSSYINSVVDQCPYPHRRVEMNLRESDLSD